MRNQFWIRRLHLVLTVAAAVIWPMLLGPAPANAAPNYKLKLLHAFCKLQGCKDGEFPGGGLLQDSTGNLYGTTFKGGKYGAGSAFKLSQNGTTWTEYILHNFCDTVGCKGGGFPLGDLIMDKDGNLYGTTFGTESGTVGAIFKLTHGEKGWSFSVLHTFNVPPATGLAYAGQATGTPWDERSPLFGATDIPIGGSTRPRVYEFTTDGSKWTYKVIHEFVESEFPNPLLVDAAGNIWGTTQLYGKYNGGLMYKLASGTWKATVLKNFCSQNGCSDGNFPTGRLVMDGHGNLFGVTAAGGQGQCVFDFNWDGCGVVFERTAGGTYSVLYKFCSLAACTDGANPLDAGLIMGGSDHLFGTTNNGGSGAHCSKGVGCGTAFVLTNNGGGSWSESVIHSFCNFSNCNDGAFPQGPLVIDDVGNLFGMTYDLGAHGEGGTVFELIP